MSSLAYSRCKKRKVLAELYINGKFTGFNVNHGFIELCKCDLNCENPHCLHAEVALLHGRSFCDTDFIEVKVNYPPCLNCAKYMVFKSVDKVIYSNHRDDKTNGIHYLIEHGVRVCRM